MSALVVSYLIVLISVALGSAVCLLFMNARMVFQIAVLWVLIITISAFTNIWLLILCTLVAVVLTRNSSDDLKVLFFVALLPVLPVNTYHIPFPGIEVLWDISFPKLLSLSLLFPLLLFSSRNIFSTSRFRASDICFLLYLVLIVLLTFRQGNFTTSIRDIFSIVVQFGLPYIVISRCIANPAQLNWFLSAFLLSMVFISFMCFFETALGWRFYSEFVLSLGLDFHQMLFVTYDRAGIPRASGGAMLQPLAIAYTVAMALIVLTFLWMKKMVGFFPFIVLAPIFLFALFVTGSRGGLLILISGILVLFYFRLSGGLRMLAGASLIFLVPLFLFSLGSIDFSSIDQEGTFEYRYQLILNSLNAVFSNPIFGSIDFFNNAALERSRQGQGIIDIVNTYLLVTLKYGFVGLFLYSMVFLLNLKDVFLKNNVYGFDQKGLLIALLIMTIIFIGTSADVSFISWYLLIVLALSRAYVEFPEDNQYIESSKTVES
jgi:O-antigen ligase